MTERDIHTNDLQLIRQILGIPQNRLDIPQRVVDLYELLRHAKHSCSQPGNLSDVELRLICLMADAISLPKPVVCKFGELTVGTPMWFRVNKFEVVECQFAGIQDATRRLYKIRLWGDIHQNIREDALFLEDPREKDKAPAKPQVTRTEDGEHEVAPKPLTDAEMTVKEQRIDAAITKLVERWPVGKRVDCCPPGDPAIVGTILGHDRSGNVKLAPDNAPAGSFAWVSAAHLYAIEPFVSQAVAATATEPVETDDEDEEGDDAPPAAVDAVIAFPKGMTVAVCEPAGESFTGTVLSHGSTGRWTGLMKIAPADGSAPCWVKAAHVTVPEPANV